MKRKIQLLFAFLIACQMGFANDGDVFTARISDGVEMTFKVISEADKTCQVGTGSYGEATINRQDVGQLSIPASANGYTVTAIASYAFMGSSITSVILPETVTVIGDRAFHSSDLKSITIPSNLTSIGSAAFYCYMLMEVTALGSNPTAFNYSGFYKKNNVSNVALIVPSGTKAIYQATEGWNTFAYIIDPADEKQPFVENGLKYGMLDNGSVCVIDGQNVVGECIIPASVNHDGTDCQVTKILDGAFSGNKSLTSIVIPDGVTGIGSFEACSGLVSVTLPKSIDPINIFREFWHCGNLTSITLPEGVVQIDESAFSGCQSLASITLPKSLKESCRYAFRGCEALTDVYIPDVVLWSSVGFNYGGSEYGNMTIPTSNPLHYANNIYLTGDREPSAEHTNFGDVSAKTLFVPIGCKEAYEQAEFWQDFKEIKEMGDGTTPLNEGETFSALTTEGVEMTFKVISTTDMTCQVGTGLDGDVSFDTSYNGPLTIPATVNGYSVVSIAPWACSGSRVTSVVVSEGIRSIGDRAFGFNSQMESISLPEGLITIGNNIVWSCPKLKSFHVPSTVEEYGTAFGWCDALEEITVAKGNTVFDSRDNCNAVIRTETNELLAGCKATVIPGTVEYLGSSSFIYQPTLSEIEIPEGVKTIDGFINASLSSITIPSSVTSIGSAFINCDNLVEVTVMGKTPFAITDYSFPDASFNGTLYVPFGCKSLFKEADIWKRFVNIVEMGLTPMENNEEVNYGEDDSIDENTDLEGTIIDNVYYNISPENGGFDAEEKCVVVNKSMSDEEVASVFGKDLQSEDVEQHFTGLIIQVPAGTGKVSINAETTGGMTLKVKIGSAQPMKIEFSGKMKVEYPYDVSEPTYVYIYASEPAASRRFSSRGGDEPSLKIFGISVEKDIIPGDANDDGKASYSDVVAVLNRIIGGTSDNKFVEAAADVNNDGQITIADALGILDIITKE